MVHEKVVLYENSSGVAWLRLNRPYAMNAINRAMCDSLAEHLRVLEGCEDVRAIVLTGVGGAFSAGADLKQVLEGEHCEPGEPDLIDVMCAQVMNVLRNFPKPVIGALNGLTMAGGLELAMCCDILVASEEAKVGDAHANFGVYPGAGGAAVLPRLIPRNIAKYLLFTGNTLSASDLQRHGLVNFVVPPEALETEVTKIAQQIVEKSPIALRRMKEVANSSMDVSQEAALRHEQVLFRQHQRSYDMQEGLTAFNEKRKPTFEGR
ncbi:MAG: enoyl-CoA hydratase/isomerase family protein [Pseudomonadota bacterium]